jgi:hypothetical protein
MSAQQQQQVAFPTPKPATVQSSSSSALHSTPTRQEQVASRTLKPGAPSGSRSRALSSPSSVVPTGTRPENSMTLVSTERDSDESDSDSSFFAGMSASTGPPRPPSSLRPEGFKSEFEPWVGGLGELTLRELVQRSIDSLEGIIAVRAYA